MRILLTSHVEHYTIGLAKELAKFVQVTVVGWQHVQAGGARFLALQYLPPKVRGLARLGFLQTSSKVYDIVHVNSAREALNIRDLEKVVLTEHGFPYPGFDPHEYEAQIRELQSLLYLNSIGLPVVTISNYSASMLRKLYGVKVKSVIYHGLLEKFLASKSRAYPRNHRLLYISRLIRFKEPHVLLGALQRLKKINLVLMLRGEGPFISEFIRYARYFDIKLLIIPKLSFQALPALYRKATALVHTCSREPFGLVVLEAMGSAMPVIVPDRGGALEVAGGAALPFQSGSSEDLADKIEAVLSDPNLYEELSRKSLERARMFSWSTAAIKYLKVYKSVHKNGGEDA